MSMYAKFHLIWINICGTSFVKHQMGQYGVGEVIISLDCWNWLKFGVLGLYGMVHMCAKFHSHWTHIASICLTMWPTGQKLKLDNAHTWVMGFVSYLAWWSYLVLGSFSKSFKSNGIPNHVLASQCPLAASKLWEIIVGVWLIKWWWNLVEINNMII